MTLVVAHRGASAAHPPGNTIDAFRAAAADGADWVELDVRLSGDGVLVVHHDPVLPDGRSVADLSAGELPGWVPDLGAALDACRGMQVNVEVKADGPADDIDRLVPAVAALLEDRAEPDRFLVTSFDWALVDRVRSAAPSLPTGLLVLRRGCEPDPVVAAVDGGHVALNPWHTLVDASFVQRAHAAALAVNVWTVDDPDLIVALARIGVDGVITNVPDIACRALGRG